MIVDCSDLVMTPFGRGDVRGFFSCTENEIFRAHLLDTREGSIRRFNFTVTVTSQSFVVFSVEEIADISFAPSCRCD